MERVGLLTIGVNATPASDTVLRFAELDAKRMSRLFTSSRGRVRKDEAHMRIGSWATAQGVLTCLTHIAYSSPEHFILYFAGHGSQQGIALADGLLEYRQLGTWLDAIPSRTKTVILATCHAGAGRALLTTGGVGLAGLDLGWDRVLRAAFPGTRILAAVDEDAQAYDDPTVKSGRFTFSLLGALRWARGDIVHQGYRWISDVRAMRATKAILARRWPDESPPCFIGPPEHLSGLPLLLSQADHLIGQASLRFVRGPVPGAALHIELNTSGRRHLATRVKWSVSDWHGPIADGQTVVFPTTKQSRFERFLTVDPAVANQAWGASLRAGWKVPLTWDVRVEDELGQTLDVRQWSSVYGVP